MKFSPTRTDPRIAILSPDIPDIERTGPVPGPSATNLWEFHFIHYAAATKNGCLLSPFPLFVGVYYFISIKILPRIEKSYPHGEKTTPFPTRPVFLTPDRTDPRFKQNIAPWLESGRGCTVRSGNPRRSGMPRSSLTAITILYLYNNSLENSIFIEKYLALIPNPNPNPNKMVGCSKS